MKKINIRPANQGDIPELVSMLERFNSEWEFAGRRNEVNREFSAGYFKSFIDYEETVTAIAERDNKICGVIGLVILRSPFYGFPIMYKSFWYAKPEYPGVGRELLRFANAVAIENDIKQFYVGSMHPRVSKLLEREGFSPQEVSYFKEFN
jgi:N-acetylglutamate synthase-like GNAT family acetyltransferase